MPEIYESKYTRKEIEQSIDGIQSRIAAVESSSSGGLSSLTTRIGTLETTVNNGHQTAIENNIKNISTNSTNIGAQAKRIDDLEKNVGAQAARITTLETNVGVQANRITTLEGKVDTVEGSINTINGSITTINNKLTQILGAATSVSKSTSGIDVTARFNRITTDADISLNLTTLSDMKDGQELYIFIKNSDSASHTLKFTNASTSATFHIIDNDGTYTNRPGDVFADAIPESGMLEVSIIKFVDGGDIYYIRMA